MSSKHGGTCPRCKQAYTEYPALSRVDNKTDICSKCGTAEAMWDFEYRGAKPLPPVNRPVS
jgi:hypothetical protein